MSEFQTADCTPRDKVRAGSCPDLANSLQNLVRYADAEGLGAAAEFLRDILLHVGDDL